MVKVLVPDMVQSNDHDAGPRAKAQGAFMAACSIGRFVVVPALLLTAGKDLSTNLMVIGGGITGVLVLLFVYPGGHSRGNG